MSRCRSPIPGGLRAVAYGNAPCAQGRWIGGQPPYGLTIDADGRLAGPEASPEAGPDIFL